jgi:CxxC motif-containing protein
MVDREFKKVITCIECPVGCKLNVKYKNKKITQIDGNQCKKGNKFAETELIDPRRILTTTITIKSVIIKRLPVRSNIPAPKGKILEMAREVKKIKINPPVKMGDIIVKNFLDSGVDIISSASIDE